MSSDLIISQSLMKELNKGYHLDELTPRDHPRCPAKAYAVYVEGMHSPPTKAMIKGNYFETLVYGGTEDGTKTKMRRKENGEKTVEEKRVELQAIKFRRKLAEERQMNFNRIREHAYVRVLPGVVFRARMDMVTSFIDEDGVFYEEVILDTKITASVDSTFGPFAWGDPITMDHTQAASYSWAFKKKHGYQVPFWYCVMDTSPQMKHKFIGGMVGPQMMQDFYSDLKRTLIIMNDYSKANHWPTAPSGMNCQNCPLKSTCKSFTLGDNVHRIFN